MCTRFVEVRKQDRRSVAVRLQIKVDHRGSTFGRPSVVDLWCSTFGRPSRLRRKSSHDGVDGVDGVDDVDGVDGVDGVDIDGDNAGNLKLLSEAIFKHPGLSSLKYPR